jgi:hypothetical protein
LVVVNESFWAPSIGNCGGYGDGSHVVAIATTFFLVCDFFSKWRNSTKDGRWWWKGLGPTIVHTPWSILGVDSFKQSWEIIKALLFLIFQYFFKILDNQPGNFYVPFFFFSSQPFKVHVTRPSIEVQFPMVLETFKNQDKVNPIKLEIVASKPFHLKTNK